MTFSIAALRDTPGESVYYDEEFRRMIEQHRIYLQDLTNGTWKTVEPGEAWRWRFDFFGLLKNMGCTPQTYWIIMRANNMRNPIEYTGELTSIWFPSESAIGRLVSLFKTQYRTN